MKKNIHPAYQDIKVACSCGNTFTVGSTSSADLHIELCPKCHPVYTNKGGVKVETGGKVDKFNKKYGNMVMQPKAKQEKAAKTEST